MKALLPGATHKKLQDFKGAVFPVKMLILNTKTNLCQVRVSFPQRILRPEFKGSSKEPAPQPKAPKPAPRFWQGSSLEKSDFGRF